MAAADSVAVAADSAGAAVEVEAAVAGVEVVAGVEAVAGGNHGEHRGAREDARLLRPNRMACVSSRREFA